MKLRLGIFPRFCATAIKMVKTEKESAKNISYAPLLEYPAGVPGGVGLQKSQLERVNEIVNDHERLKKLVLTRKLVNSWGIK